MTNLKQMLQNSILPLYSLCEKSKRVILKELRSFDEFGNYVTRMYLLKASTDEG